MIFKSLETLQNHIEDNKTRYYYEYKQEKFFGDSFLDRMNWRIRRFLDSCAGGDEENMDTKMLKFNDMMEQVKRCEYQTKIPAWILKITKTKEPTPTQD